MAHVMRLKDGRCETVFDGRDFTWLVEQYMGDEAAGYASELAESADALEAENEELTKDYEQDMDEMRESRHELLLNVRELAEELLDLLSAPRLRREKISRAAGDIYRLANDEL